MYGGINKNYFPKDFIISLRVNGMRIKESCHLHSCFFSLQEEKQTMMKIVVVEN